MADEIENAPPESEPAFPCDQHFGISTRDYFAAAAMTGFCASAEFATKAYDNASIRAQTAHAAYAVADAMLSARLYALPAKWP
jgi:hypothetical protein